VTCVCEGIVSYIGSLRGSASREVDIDILKSVSKSDDSALLIVGFFNTALADAFQTYNEASKILVR